MPNKSEIWVNLSQDANIATKEIWLAESGKVNKSLGTVVKLVHPWNVPVKLLTLVNPVNKPEGTLVKLVQNPNVLVKLVTLEHALNKAPTMLVNPVQPLNVSWNVVTLAPTLLNNANGILVRLSHDWNVD